jgi:hypothetical protein
MGQDTLDRHRRAVGVRILDPEPRKVLAHRVVEPELALVAQLHHTHRREQLRDRADGIHRLGGRRTLSFTVGMAEGSDPEKVLVVHHGHGDARYLLVRPLGIDPHLEEVECLLYAGVARLRRLLCEAGGGEQ